MGEYANDSASNDFESYLTDKNDDVFNNTISLSWLPYLDIKVTTTKSVLIKLNIQVSPFHIEKYDIDYMWIPLKECQIDKDKKLIKISTWLLERKIDEQCSIIAQRIHKK